MSAPATLKRWGEVLRRLPPGPCSVAEIGVWRGEMCGELLNARRDLSMWLVDPWKPGTPGTSWYNSESKMPRFAKTQYDMAFERVCRIADMSRGRATILRMPSVTGALHVPDGSVDLVFLDGDHSEAGVAADIDAWLPKVKPGGWIGGHDYGERFRGVAAAVHTAFGEAVDLGSDHTWFVRVAA